MPRTDHYKWDASDFLGGGAFGEVFKVWKNYSGSIFPLIFIPCVYNRFFSKCEHTHLTFNFMCMNNE